MPPRLRHYDHTRDYETVSRFLFEHYRVDVAGHINWAQPRWEYMCYHPCIRNVDLSTAGVWHDDGRLVAVVHPEHDMGQVYLEIALGYDSLKADMLTHAERHISVEEDDKRRLDVFINDADEQLRAIATERGYEKGDWVAPMCDFTVPDQFPPIVLPDGFRIQSLADENDLLQIEKVLWRGFNHEGEQPPDDGLADMKLMQSAPNYRHDLNIIAVAPDGQYVSYGGIWFDPVNRYGYVEPVATDPDYRLRGLGKAVVTESIRRVAELGATYACVGGVRPIYTSIGFKTVYTSTIWRRRWD